MRRHVVSLVIAIALAAALAACGGKSPTSPTYPTATITSMPSMDDMLSEKAIGSSTAPNTIVVYSSYTCPHCATFDLNVVPLLKAADLDTGKARFIFRDYPLDTWALTAAMLARCAGSEKFFAAADAMFRNQSYWTSSGEQALVSVMRQFGMAQSVVDQCRANTALQDAILQNKAAATPIVLFGVPTVVVNGTSLSSSELGTVLGGSLAPIEKYFR